jgi:hypothetical protein
LNHCLKQSSKTSCSKNRMFVTYSGVFSRPLIFSRPILRSARRVSSFCSELPCSCQKYFSSLPLTPDYFLAIPAQLDLSGLAIPRPQWVPGLRPQKSCGLSIKSCRKMKMKAQQMTFRQDITKYKMYWQYKMYSLYCSQHLQSN